MDSEKLNTENMGGENWDMSDAPAFGAEEELEGPELEDNSAVEAQEAESDLTEEDYQRDALRNLMAMSRTANGTVDVSASAGKKDSMTGVDGQEAANLARENFQKAIHEAYENRGRKFESPEELRQFVEELATQINGGLVKEGMLIRSTDSDKYPYTRIADLEDTMQQFYQELYAKLEDPEQDPVEAAAFAEFGIDFVGHFFADGCGKTSKVVSSFVLMRSGHSLPDYKRNGGDRKFYYSHTLKQIAGIDPEADKQGYEDFVNYYRTLFEEEN